MSLDNQDMVFVKLISCRAVTPGGNQIFADEKDHYNISPVLQAPLSDYRDKPGVYAVIVKINPYDRIAVGNALPAELPPRIPYSTQARKS